MNPAVLHGKIAIVTGASSGIGASIAQSLLSSGLKVAGLSRSKSRLLDLEKQFGAAFLPLEVDVKDDAALLNALHAVEEHWGHYDILINAAGLGYQDLLGDGSEQHWRETLEVNVIALSIASREAIKHWKSRAYDGHILQLSSLAAHRITQGAAMYSASKYAVRALTEGLRQELRSQASKIRISSISPGYVETKFHENFFQESQRAAELYSSCQVLQAKDIADAALYILSAPPHVEVHDLLIRSVEQLT